MAAVRVKKVRGVSGLRGISILLQSNTPIGALETPLTLLTPLTFSSLSHLGGTRGDTCMGAVAAETDA